jgi:hypothetical protein
MSYSYYQFVRIICTIGFAYLAYSANKNNLDNEVIEFVILTLLFQPFATVALNKTTWNIIDIIVGIGLIISMKNNKQNL